MLEGKREGLRGNFSTNSMLKVIEQVEDSGLRPSVGDDIEYGGEGQGEYDGERRGKTKGRRRKANGFRSHEGYH